jgi:competence ComEA-like helix-hairpin-helix protein
MKRVPSYLIATAACALFVSTLMSASASGHGVVVPQQQQAGSSVTDDPANELFVQMCNRCHDAARITALRRTKTEWEEIINKMIERGATGSEDDFQTVFGFLRRHYGKVFINSAGSEEMTITLGLSSKDADAVLAYRKANGNFTDFDAVKKVPDIDVKVLEEHKDAVAF